MLFQPSQNLYKVQPKSINAQRGVVIVIALFFVALIATMSYMMISRLDRDIRRTTLMLRSTQAEYYAQGSIAWAQDMLVHNFLNQKPNKLVDKLPIESQVSEREGYKIKSTIYDMQSGFNINKLQNNSETQSDFLKLMKTAIPELSNEKAQAIIQSISEWMKPATDESDEPSAEYYTKLPLPYRPAHRAMQSISELRLVKNVTADIYNKLKPYLVALPTEKETPINIQTASLPVLASLSPELTLEAAKTIEDIRNKQEITSTQAWLSMEALSRFGIPKEKITVISQFFLIKTEVSIEEQHIVLYTLVERAQENANATMHTIWQSKNVPG